MDWIDYRPSTVITDYCHFDVDGCLSMDRTVRIQEKVSNRGEDWIPDPVSSLESGRYIPVGKGGGDEMR